MNSPDLLETLSARFGVVENISYHQKRVNRVLKYFNSTMSIDLEKLLNPPQKQIQTRCRLLYNNLEFSISYHSYTPKLFRKFKIVSINEDFDYKFKYAKRDFFESLFKKYPEYDEFILTQNNIVKECSIANIAFYNKELNHYVTPSTVLLEGTTRERLLNESKIITKEIKSQDILGKTEIVLLNAMLGFFKINNVIIE